LELFKSGEHYQTANLIRSKIDSVANELIRLSGALSPLRRMGLGQPLIKTSSLKNLSPLGEALVPYAANA
jgi:hypothetical protein